MGDDEEVMECYEFNERLDPSLDDGECIHCRKYLTLSCPHIDEFLDDLEDFEVD